MVTSLSHFSFSHCSWTERTGNIHKTNIKTQQQQQSSKNGDPIWMNVNEWNAGHADERYIFANNRCTLGLFVFAYPLYSFPLLFILEKKQALVFPYFFFFYCADRGWTRLPHFSLGGSGPMSSCFTERDYVVLDFVTLHLSKPNSIHFILFILGAPGESLPWMDWIRWHCGPFFILLCFSSTHPLPRFPHSVIFFPCIFPSFSNESFFFLLIPSLKKQGSGKLGTFLEKRTSLPFLQSPNSFFLFQLNGIRFHCWELEKSKRYGPAGLLLSGLEWKDKKTGLQVGKTTEDWVNEWGEWLWAREGRTRARGLREQGKNPISARSIHPA